MNMKKLTLNMNEEDIRTFRRLAKEHGTSVSDMATRLVRAIDARKRRAAGNELEDLPPITRQALGLARLPEGKTDRDLLEEALLEKHGLDR